MTSILSEHLIPRLRRGSKTNIKLRVIFTFSFDFRHSWQSERNYDTIW